MKLKTLKDFEGMIKDKHGHRLYDEIRKEAIKWVKQEVFKKKELPYSLQGYMCWDDINDWIKHFFNITSEDLK